MKIKSIHLEFFKGVTDKTYDFFDRTKISAENGEGKSTIADAHFWLWCGRNYELVNEPNIRPNNVAECQPRVTEVIEHNGREIIVCKYQKCTKKESDGKVEYAYANKYEINAVGKSKRDFDKYFEDEGIDIAKTLACMHPEVFTRQKDKDMRPVILSMASSKSDLEIAQMNDDTKLLAELLKNNKLDEIIAMQKDTKNKAKARQDEIPNIIEGLEMAKVDVDVTEAELKVKVCKDKIAELDEIINNSGKALSDLMGKAMKLKFDISAIQQPMTDKLISDRRNFENDIKNAESEKERAENHILRLKSEVILNKERIQSLSDEVETMRGQYTELRDKDFTGKIEFNGSDWQFDESSTVCSLCGQKLPEDKISELKSSFEQKKADAEKKAVSDYESAKAKFVGEKKSQLDKINHSAKSKIDEKDSLISKNTELEKEISEYESKISQYNAEIEKATAELNKLPTEVDYTANSEYVSKKSELDKVESEIENLKNADDPAIEFRSEKANFEKELAEANKLIAQASVNVANDEKIAELEREEKEKEQVATDAQQILDQIDILSRRKNELLVDEINSHFKIVKWKLFDYQKNGEYKDVCIPMIGDKTFTDSMNTGLKIQAKLDICDSIQKFYGMDLPIFLDNAESINDKNIPTTDCQLVVLKVTEDAELKVEEM